MDDVVEILRTLLPLGTAVLGFIGGLVAIPLTDDRRRDAEAKERRRLAMARALNVLAEAALTQPTADHHNRFVVDLNTAGYGIELELTGAEAITFHTWFDKRQKDVYRWFLDRDSPEKTSYFTRELDILSNHLIAWYRGQVTMEFLSKHGVFRG